MASRARSPPRKPGARWSTPRSRRPPPGTGTANRCVSSTSTRICAPCTPRPARSSNSEQSRRYVGPERTRRSRMRCRTSSSVHRCRLSTCCARASRCVRTMSRSCRADARAGRCAARRAELTLREPRAPARAPPGRSTADHSPRSPVRTARRTNTDTGVGPATTARPRNYVHPGYSW